MTTTLGEIDTHLELPVTVEYTVCEDIEIIRITVAGVEGIVEDISSIQYDALVDLIERQLAADRIDALEFKADCERDNRLSDEKNERDARWARARENQNGEQR